MCVFTNLYVHHRKHFACKVGRVNDFIFLTNEIEVVKNSLVKKVWLTEL